MKAQKSDSKSWLIGSGISFLLGCLSKETAVTMVLIAPLTLWIFSENNSIKESMLKALPAIIAGAFLYAVKNHYSGSVHRQCSC